MHRESIKNSFYEPYLCRMEKLNVLPWHEQALWLLGIFLGGLILGLAFYWIIKKILRVSHSELSKDLPRVKNPFVFVVIVLSLQLWPELYFESKTPFITQLSQIVNILAVTWLLIGMVKGIRDSIVRRYKQDVGSSLKLRKLFTQVRLFERIVIVIIVILAIALILMTFDSIRRVGVSILTSAGIAGVIIGLAAQRLIANLLAGFQLAITQPIRLGDVVIVEGEWGTIHEMTLTYVVVAIWDKRMLVVPSTYFIEKPFQNWTRKSGEMLGTVYLYVDYHLPLEPVRKELKRIVKDNPMWDGETANIQVTGSTEKAMEIRALIGADNANDAWNLRVHVREKLIEFLQKEFPEMLPKSRVTLEKDG